MKRTEYPVLLKAATEGGFVVTCRDLPHLITQGEDFADALAQAADAMDEVFATYLHARRHEVARAQRAEAQRAYGFSSGSAKPECRVTP